MAEAAPLLPPLADHAIRVDHAADHPPAGTQAPAPERLDDAAVEERLARLEDLLGRLEQVPGRTAELALEVVETLVEVYGEAFGRVVAAAEQAPDVLAALTADELVRHLLLLHRVHPDPVEARVARALADAGPMLQSRGAVVEPLGVADGVARVRLASGSCAGCGSSTDEVQEQLRDEVLAAAPELDAVLFVDPPRAPAVIPVEALLRRPASSSVAGG